MSKCVFSDNTEAVKPNISKPPILLDNLPLETLIQYQQPALDTATKVFNCAIQNQSKVYTLHGPSSEHENKEKFPHIYSGNTGNDFLVKEYDAIHINPNKNNVSFVLSGLQNNTIIIHGKVNHILIRKSKNIHLDIKAGTISGIDIIYCNKMTVKMPCHNFTNLEHVQGIYLQADINDVSQLHITGSLDVKINDISIPINPFINAFFGKDGWCYKRQSAIPKLMIYKY